MFLIVKMKNRQVFLVQIKKISIFAATKYEMGATIMTMVEELSEWKLTKSEVYEGNDPFKIKIYELKITQYVNNLHKLENECKKLHTIILGQCTSYMTAKLKALPTFKKLHADKNPVELLKAIKGLTFKFDNEKEYEMSLVEAIDKLYQIHQTKEMTKTQFLDKFNNLVDVIEHYGGAIVVYPSITNGLLAKYTGGVFDEVNWRLTYTDS
jgi:hypothetical protein